MNPYDYGLWMPKPEEISRYYHASTYYLKTSERIRVTKASLDKLDELLLRSPNRPANYWGTKSRNFPEVPIWIDGKSITLDLNSISLVAKGGCHQTFVAMLDKPTQVRFKKQLGIKYGSRGVRFIREELKGKHTKPFRMRYATPQDRRDPKYRGKR